MTLVTERAERRAGRGEARRAGMVTLAATRRCRRVAAAERSEVEDDA